jgi:L-ectoine synthase
VRDSGTGFHRPLGMTVNNTFERGKSTETLARSPHRLRKNRRNSRSSWRNDCPAATTASLERCREHIQLLAVVSALSEFSPALLKPLGTPSGRRQLRKKPRKFSNKSVWSETSLSSIDYNGATRPGDERLQDRRKRRSERVIVRTAEELHGTAAEVSTEQWTSTRLLLKDDGLGFTVTHTVVEPGMDEILWYKHHLEACYCIEGRATLEDLSTGEVHEIGPGTMYALDQHDRHRLRTDTRVRLVCVFMPPLTGQETHDSDGSYALPEDLAGG